VKCPRSPVAAAAWRRKRGIGHREASNRNSGLDHHYDHRPFGYPDTGRTSGSTRCPNILNEKEGLNEEMEDDKLMEHLDEVEKRVQALLHEYGPIWRFTTTSGRNVRQDVVTYSVAKALVEYVCATTGKYAPEHVAIIIDDLCTLMNEEFESDCMRRVFERGL
jgi:hypothetical protein